MFARRRGGKSAKTACLCQFLIRRRALRDRKAHQRKRDPAILCRIYGETKLKGEQIALSYGRKFQVSVIRPGAVYGPRETDIFAYFKMVRQGLVLIPGDGKQEISFVHVADVVDSILRAGQMPKRWAKFISFPTGKATDGRNSRQWSERSLKRSFMTFRIPMGVVRIVAELGELGAKMTGKPPW